MNLSFDSSLAVGYKSKSQIARIITEGWVGENMYCPRCGCGHLLKSPNNSKVDDFHCEHCGNTYELKSKNGSFSGKVGDGAYEAMIERINGGANPDFMFMGYGIAVSELFIVPKYFFVPDIIERRSPLAATARRAGWIGCNIILEKIPRQGRVYIVKNGAACEKDSVLENLERLSGLQTPDIAARGWLLDVLNIVNSIPGTEFSLADVYSFEGTLAAMHPDNNNVRAKIRQQLQFLRDKGFIKFTGKGNYTKV